MKALVVDDSAVMRKIVIAALSQAGVTEVGEAANGQEGVNAALQGGYSVITLDWNMPTMSGIDALRAIRAGGVRTPVIMVTTEAEKDRVIEALKAGASNYVVKPFKPEVIAAKVRDALAKATP